MLAPDRPAVALSTGVGVIDRGPAVAFNRSWTVLLRARLRGRVLDRALIEGADPAASPQLAAHSARLTRRSTRSSVADSLDRLARTHLEPARLWGVLPSREAVRTNLGELHALAALLRGPIPVYAQGVAMLRTLVADGTGPAYTDRDGRALAARLTGARRAMSG